MFRFLFLFIVVISCLFVIDDFLYWNYDYSLFYGDLSYDFSDVSDNYFEDSKCNVLGIELFGDMVIYEYESDYYQTSSDSIVSDIMFAERDSSVDAILLEVSSHGGSPVAAEEVSNALRRANKPTVVVIRDVGTSAAYIASTGADKIFASKNSDIFGMGVTMSYLDYTEYNRKEGIKYIDLSSGEFKNTGDPDRPLSQKEKDLLMRDVNIMHQNFVELIAENRGLEIANVDRLADGSTMMGQMALDNGLIDSIGDIYSAKDYLRELLGKEVDICW